MAYFNYLFGTHLFRPSTVQNNLSYNGVPSTVASPFSGESINLNFFNLGAFANDATIRLSVLEASAQLAYNTSPGYISYTARQETEGAFYSGIPLVINPSASAIATPYTFSQPLAFQAASGNGVVMKNGTVDLVNSKFTSFSFGVAGETGPYASPAALTTYLNSKLVFNTLTANATFGFSGTANVYSVGSTQWNSTWGNLSVAPKSFWIYVNDQKTTNTGTLVTLSQSVPYASSIATLATVINSAIQVAIGSQAPAVLVAPDVSSTYVTLTQTTNVRSSGGCYEIRVERVSGDLSSPLDWLGWTTNTSSNFTETWDYTSLFTFVANSSSPLGVSIQGTGPYCTLAFKPQDSSNTIQDFLAAFSLPTAPSLYFHTRLPLTTYTNRSLNFGGSLTVNNLTANGNLTVNGTVNYAGSAVYTGTLSATNFGFVSTTNTPLLAPVFYPGTVVPSYVQSVRANWNGPFSANTFIIPSSNPVDVGWGSLVGSAFGATTWTLGFPAMPANGTIVPQFATQQSGFLDRSTTAPTHKTRLNYDGDLYATDLYVQGYSYAPQHKGHVVPGYVVNSLFEVDQVAGVQPSGWVLTMNTTPGAAPTPTSLTPGSLNAGTIFRTNATNPLIGGFDAVFTRPAVNQQGAFAYTTFTIDKGVAGQWHQVRFNYLASANYTAGDVAVFLYDVTGNTVITPTISAVPVSGATTPGFFTTYFKTTANTNNQTYWVILHIAGTTTTTWTFEVGGVSVTDLTVGAQPRAEYYATSSTIPATTVQINFDTIVENVGGGIVTLGAGAWKYQPPLPGMYLVTAYAASSNGLTGFSVGTSFFALDLYKNGTAGGNTRLASKFPDATTGSMGGLSGSTTIRLATTDFIDVRIVDSTFTGLPTFNTGTITGSPRITISWIGF